MKALALMRLLAAPSAFAVAAVIGVFLAYELIERLLLPGMELEQLRRAHVVRGVASSLAAASVVTWMLLRRSPSLLAADQSPTPDGTHTDEDLLRQSAQWFVHMRWVAVAVATALVVLALPVAGVLPPAALLPLALGVAALALANVVHSRLLVPSPSPRSPTRLLALQIHLDLALIAYLLHFSGGVDNPLYALPALHVALAGVLLSPRQCYLVALVATGLVAAVAFGSWSGAVAHYPLALSSAEPTRLDLAHVTSRVGVQAALHFLVAFIVSKLAEHSRANARRYAQMVERALAERQLLARALETTGTGLRVVDRDARPRWSNQRWDEWFSNGWARARDQAIRQTISDSAVRVAEVTLDGCDFASPGEEVRTLHITTAPILGANGEVAEVVELAQDITAFKQAQAQMVRAGSMAAVGELAGQVAHEVNNPIAIISAKGRLMLSGHRAEMSQKVAQEIGKIVDLSDRVASIAQGLLSYCRPSPKTRTIIDLAAPARQAITMISDRARTSNIEIEDRLAPSIGLVRANEGEMGQVFLNLLLNALDAMPSGGILTIAGVPGAGLADGRRAIGIAVSDTGDGVPDELRLRIWEPFFSTKGEARGTGLGLSICQGLVTDHGGQIDVGSSDSGGACFVVQIPEAKREAAHDEEQQHGQAKNLGS